jgi:hypothetical protein
MKAPLGSLTGRAAESRPYISQIPPSPPFLKGGEDSRVRSPNAPFKKGKRGLSFFLGQSPFYEEGAKGALYFARR